MKDNLQSSLEGSKCFQLHQIKKISFKNRVIPTQPPSMMKITSDKNWTDDDVDYSVWKPYLRLIFVQIQQFDNLKFAKTTINQNNLSISLM